MDFILKLFNNGPKKPKKTQYEGFLQLFNKKYLSDSIDKITPIDFFVSDPNLDKPLKDFFESFYSTCKEKNHLVKNFFTILIKNYTVVQIEYIFRHMSYKGHHPITYSNLNYLIEVAFSLNDDIIVIQLLKWATLIFSYEGNKGMRKITGLFKSSLELAIKNDNRTVVKGILLSLGFNLELIVGECPVDFDIPCVITDILIDQNDVGWFYNVMPIILKKVKPDVVWKSERTNDTPNYFIKEYFEDLYKKFVENPKIGLLLYYKLLLTYPLIFL